MKRKQGAKSDTVIEEITVTYDSGLAIAYYHTATLAMQLPPELLLPKEQEYAATTTAQRQRAKRAYPKPRPAQPLPPGEDLDIL